MTVHQLFNLVFSLETALVQVIVPLLDKNVAVPTKTFHVASSHSILPTKVISLLGVTLDVGNEQLVVDVPVKNPPACLVPQEAPPEVWSQRFQNSSNHGMEVLVLVMADALQFLNLAFPFIRINTVLHLHVIAPSPDFTTSTPLFMNLLNVSQGPPSPIFVAGLPAQDAQG